MFKLFARLLGVALFGSLALLEVIAMMKGVSFYDGSRQVSSWVFWSQTVYLAPVAMDYIILAVSLSVMWLFRFTEDQESTTTLLLIETKDEVESWKGKATQMKVAVMGNVSEAEAAARKAAPKTVLG